MKFSGLKLDGKPLELNSLTPTAKRVLSFLDQSPADEVFTSDGLARRLKIKTRILRDDGTKECFERYTLRPANARYWGNPRAIDALRKQVQP